MRVERTRGQQNNLDDDYRNSVANELSILKAAVQELNEKITRITEGTQQIRIGVRLFCN